MVFQTCTLLAMCVMLAACGSDKQVNLERAEPSIEPNFSMPEDPEAVQLEGLYTSSFERSAFKPCDIDEVWWTDFNTGNPYEMNIAMGIEPDDPDWQSKRAINRFVRMRGFVVRTGSPDEGFGHMGKYQGQIDVIELLEARDATEEELNRCHKG